MGQSRPGRTDSKSVHVRYSAESGSKFRALAAPLRAVAGWSLRRGCDSSSETGASNHASRT